MDAGCYCVSLLRHLVGEEPEVSAAQATLGRPRVDRLMEAELRFPSGVSAHLRTSIRSRYLLQVSLRAVGERGELRILNPVAPHLFHRLSVRSPEGRRSERVAGEKTYTAQLRAFVAAVREGKELPTGAEDGVANMRVIDAIYERAGLPLRGC